MDAATQVVLHHLFAVLIKRTDAKTAEDLVFSLKDSADYLEQRGHGDAAAQVLQLFNRAIIDQRERS